MKIIGDLVHKRCIFHIVFIISLLVLTTCEKNRKIDEIDNNETITEDKSIEIPENRNDPRKENPPLIVEDVTPYLSYRYTLPADGTYTRGYYDMEDNFFCSIHDKKMNKENIEIYYGVKRKSYDIIRLEYFPNSNEPIYGGSFGGESYREIYVCEECNEIWDRCKMLFGLEYGGNI